MTRLETGQFKWQSWENSLAVASDLDEFIARVANAGASDVLSIRVAGQIGNSAACNAFVRH